VELIRCTSPIPPHFWSNFDGHLCMLEQHALAYWLVDQLIPSLETRIHHRSPTLSPCICASSPPCFPSCFTRTVRCRYSRIRSPQLTKMLLRRFVLTSNNDYNKLSLFFQALFRKAVSTIEGYFFILLLLDIPSLDGIVLRRIHCSLINHLLIW